ncbi:MAG TPA: hypothetical protein VFV70_12265 [Hyphomonadaceae bacterium]|nr:hypothetical protein [Hyphomonadaceae bacterium]
MIRIVMAATAALVMSSACGAVGGGDKQAIVNECVKQGDDRKQCECIATAMEKHMDKDLFHAAALEVQGKSDEAQKIAEKVGPDKAMASATAAMGPMMQCAMGGSSSS